MRRWSMTVVVASVISAMFATAGWQYYGYMRERSLIEESLHQQAHAIASAVIGGANSHRRKGAYFVEQLQLMLEELVKSQDVMAAAVRSSNGQVSVHAGETSAFDSSLYEQPGDYWTEKGFQIVEPFQLEPSESGGYGLGRGRGGRFRENADAADAESADRDYVIAVLLSRSRADLLMRHASQSHALAVSLAWLAIGLLTWAWRASVRFVEARGKTQLLETEASYLHELSQAAAGLAHETRNPLGLIRGWTQRLAELDGDTDVRQQHSHAVVEECDRLTARINQFLAFAKPQSPNVTGVAPGELVEELNVLLQPDLDSKQVRLELEISPVCHEIRADRELLRQALFNLLQNAIQFSPDCGMVTISCRADRHHWCLEVADRGPGVCEPTTQLFTPYVSTRPEGTGLGLAIVKKIAGLHGWKVSYHARKGGGAVFRLEGSDG